MKGKNYNIIISSGDLDQDGLNAEIYSNSGTYIGSFNHNGTYVVADFTCEANNEICNGKREIILEDFVTAINESLEALGIKQSLTIKLTP